MQSKTREMCGAIGILASLATASAAMTQTVTALADNRSGSIFATNNAGPPSSASFAIVPETSYTPVYFTQTVTDGGASASLDTQSQWLGFASGNSTTGFTAHAALDVALGAISGSCNSTDHVQVSFGVSGVPSGQTIPFSFQGSVTNTFSSATVTLVGPGVNMAYGSSSSWGQIVQFGNGTYTLTIDASSSLTGTGPDIGNLDYSVTIERVPTVPANDTCDHATPITEGAIPVTTVGATGQLPISASCTGGTPLSIFHDVYYRYVATATGTATVSTCGGLSIDTVLAVFTGSCAGLEYIGCNDDACDLQSAVTFPTVCGEAYTIVLGGFSPEPADVGSGTMTLTQTGGCFPPEACAQAFPVYQGFNNAANWYPWAADVVLPASCGLGGDSTIHKGAFWTWTAPASGQVTITTCDTQDVPVDSRLAAFTGTCDDPQWVACNDNACGILSTISFYATCGQHYTIVLGSADGTIANWTLSISQAGALCNDQCSGATPVFAGDNVITTIGATGATVVPASCGGGQPMVIANDVFYTYAATATGTVSVSTCGGVNFDSRLGVFAGSCASPTWIACNDDGPGCHFFSSALSFAAECGKTYTIVVGNNPDNLGPGSGLLTITQSGTCPDTCEEAVPLALGATLVSTLGMTGVVTLPPTCEEGFGLALHNDAFFTYDATADGTATISTCDPATTFDTRLAVYTGTCGSLNLLGCNDDSPGCGVMSNLSFPTTCGERYIIQLGAFDNNTGTALVTLSQTGTCRSACPADLNQNGSVGADDLAVLLGQWGGPGTGDLDGNGTVSSADLAILLGAWGACP
ncbi:MAG: hypothetical protein U0572_10885 [Phycisphaerales bacterium]